MTVKNKLKPDELIEKYKNAPDFFDQSIDNVHSRSIYDDQLIHAACVSGDVQDVQTLIDLGSDINSKGDMGYTPLHYAVEQGHYDVVKLLIEKGANISSENFDGDTPQDLALILQENLIADLLREQIRGV